MKFWQYQRGLIGGLALSLTRMRKVIGQLPTGGGKTVIFSGISKSYIDNVANTGKSVMILVHRKKLLKQTRRSLYNMFKIDCQVVIAGMKHIPYSRIYVGMVETVQKRLDLIHNIGMIIIDEAHIANFNKIHKHFEDALIIGFTATPLAASKKDPLKNYYEDIVVGPQISVLIDINKSEPDKGLVQNVTFAPKDTVDRRDLSVSKTTGDFQVGQMSMTFSKPKYVKNTVDAYRKHADRTKAIVFNVNIDHSKLVCDAFVGAGYNCRHIDSEMSDHEQEVIYNWFETTPAAILCNVGVATTGVDVPSIETVIVNRATTSLSLWLQMCGRGSRPYDGKIMFAIIDMGGNGIIHGDWCDARDWVDLFHNPPKPGDPKDIPPPVKICPACEALVPAPCRTCTYCGYIFPSAAPAPEKEINDYVVITKGINVKELIEKNKSKKRYAAFYHIGKDIAYNATKILPAITSDVFTHMLDQYIKLATQWAAEHNHKLAKWHYDEAKKTLDTELKKYYHSATWDTGLLSSTAIVVEHAATDIQAAQSPTMREQVEQNRANRKAINMAQPVEQLPDFNSFDNYFKL